MTIQLLVFGAYFIAIFLIGWFSMRATQSEADYWVADGKLGWLIGGSTMAATHASAGTERSTRRSRSPPVLATCDPNDG